jgi:NTE family protein
MPDISSLGASVRRTLRRIRELAYAQQAPATRPRLGLALGGGFARGIAHLGVLNVLEENGLRPDCLGGTSAGSLIAAGYASGTPLPELTRLVRSVRWRDFARWRVSRMGLASNERMESFIRRFFRSRRFEDLRIPLVVVATDLVSGQAVAFTSGDLATALRASCAYPGLFEPVRLNGSLLADGGLVWSVPTGPVAQLGAELVTAVWLGTGGNGPSEPRSVLEVLSRSFTIAAQAGETLWRDHADLIIEPPVGHFRWDDFDRADELIRAGEQAARQALPRLRALLTGHQAPLPSVP